MLLRVGMTKDALSLARACSWFVLAGALGCSSPTGADDNGLKMDDAGADALVDDASPDSLADASKEEDTGSIIPDDVGTMDGSSKGGDGGVAADSGIGTTTNNLWVSTLGKDTNAGTKESPFLTILHASTVAKPDTTIHVEPGNYTGGFRTNTSGTASGRIYYVSETLHGAKIVPPASSSSNVGWDNRGAYVTIYGFEIDGTNDPKSGAKWSVGLNMAGQGDVASHNLVHNIFNTGTPSGSGGAGILLDAWYGFNDMHALANIVHHVGPPSGGGSWYHGIYQTATGSIENNLSYANAGGGIHLWHDAHSIDVFNNTSFGNGYGFIVGGGDFVHTSGPCDNIRVVNNIAYDNTTIGFDEEGVVGTHNLWTHNLSFGHPTNWRLKVSTHTADVTFAPMFVKYVRTGGGDYHLAKGSPAIDVGSPTLGTKTDLDDMPRPYGGVIDLGAYEWRP